MRFIEQIKSLLFTTETTLRINQKTVLVPVQARRITKTKTRHMPYM
ncbi:MAG: hypothetical protein VX737_00960 [Pseudomonadota bacterium]|nr:hypothetical protein [Pseudomonadota bacterium]